MRKEPWNELFESNKRKVLFEKTKTTINNSWFEQYNPIGNVNPDALTRKVLFEKYKEPKFSNIFPMVQGIAAQTIGLDLVSIQPMSAPSNGFYYLELIYGNPDALTRTVLFEKYTEPDLPKRKPFYLDYLY